MKKVINEIVFGKNAAISALIALAVVAFIALGCGCGKNFDLANLAKDIDSNTSSNTRTDTPDDSLPSSSVVEGLVKGTTAEFADAVNSGDFSEMYSNASSDFQSTYTEDQMKEAFKSYTKRKSFVLPILRKVASANASFTSAPSFRTERNNNILMASGSFPTKPFKVRFDYEYIKRDGKWKLLKLVINIP